MTENNNSPTKGMGRGRTLGAGLLAGLVAALLMTLLQLALRYFCGIPTPSDLVGDRIAPAMSVDTFFYLLYRAGDYNKLKQLGFGSVIIGELVVGALGGVLYAFVVERVRARQPESAGRFRVSRGSLMFAAAIVGVLWIASLALLWPVLGTNYGGFPPRTATFITALALLATYGVFGVALMIGYGLLTSHAPMRQPAPADAPTARRAVLLGGFGVVVAVVAGTLMRRLYNVATFSYDGTQYRGADVQAITPNDRFYVVTKNVIDPHIEADNWHLEIGGMVNQPRSYTFAELTAMPATTQETTLMCISNEVGGGLMSNAIWKGVPLRTLIEAAGAQPGVKEVFLHGVDNYSDTFPIEKALDPTTLLVYEMNGVPLPHNHGFPARIIVPGLFGEKHVKWITRIELVAEDAKGFYEQQGWGPNFVVPTHSRFDAPDFGQPLPVNQNVPLKGIAFGGNRGVSRVEISTDDGQTWQQAQITSPGTRLSWALWKFDWRPAQSGEYKLSVRATDGDGQLQTAEQRGTVPQGSTGYHKVTAKVMA